MPLRGYRLSTSLCSAVSSMLSVPAKEGDAHALVFLQAQVVKGQPLDFLQVGKTFGQGLNLPHVLQAVVKPRHHHVPHPQGDVPLLRQPVKGQGLFMSALQWSRYSSGVANFKSPKIKSVWSSTRQALSQSAHTPEVSNAVWMPSPWSRRTVPPQRRAASGVPLRRQ